MLHKERAVKMEAREKIIEAAKKLIDRYGFRKFTMDEISSELGMSKRTIYMHFKNKEELVDGVIDSFVQKDLDAMDQAVSATDDPVEQLRSVFYIYDIESLKKHHVEELRTFNPEKWERLQAFTTNRREYVYRIYQRGVELGVFRKECPPVRDPRGIIPAEETSSVLYFMLSAIMDQALLTSMQKYGFDINAMLVNAFEIIVGAFLVEKD